MCPLFQRASPAALNQDSANTGWSPSRSHTSRCPSCICFGFILDVSSQVVRREEGSDPFWGGFRPDALDAERTSYVKVAQSLIISLPHELQQSGEFPITAFGCHTDPKLTSSASTSRRFVVTSRCTRRPSVMYYV